MALLTPEETVTLQSAGFLVREFTNANDGEPRVQIGGAWKVFPDEVDTSIKSLVNMGRLKWSYSGSDPMLRTKFLVYRERPPRGERK